MGGDGWNKWNRTNSLIGETASVCSIEEAAHTTSFNWAPDSWISIFSWHAYSHATTFHYLIPPMSHFKMWLIYAFNFKSTSLFIRYILSLHSTQFRQNKLASLIFYLKISSFWFHSVPQCFWTLMGDFYSVYFTHSKKQTSLYPIRVSVVGLTCMAGHAAFG